MARVMPIPSQAMVGVIGAWMAGGQVSLEMLELEVRELTGLLRYDGAFAGLRGVLAAKGIPASAVVLAGLIGGEDQSRCGVVLTPDRECILFEFAPEDSLVRWEVIDDPGCLRSSFQAVFAAIAMAEAGQVF